MNNLEDFLVKTFGLLNVPSSNEVNTFIHRASGLNRPSLDEIEKIASQSFSTYGKGKRSLNESQADTLHDLMTLIKTKAGKSK